MPFVVFAAGIGAKSFTYIPRKRFTAILALVIVSHGCC